jgi:hypothetical protein
MLHPTTASCVAALLLVIGTGAGCGRSSPSGPAPVLSARAASVAKAVAQVKGLLPDSGIITAQVGGPVIHVELTSKGGGRGTAALWNGELLAASVNTTLKADGQDTVAEAIFTDQYGNDLSGASTPIDAGTSPSPLSPNACEESARANAPQGATVALAHTLPLAGGACVFVVRADNVVKFVRDAGQLTGPLLAKIPNARTHPYLFEVVDSKNEPQLVVGWVPGLGGGIGQGLGWVKPGLHSSAIIGP